MKTKGIILICIVSIAILLILSVGIMKTGSTSNVAYQPMKAYNPNPPDRAMWISPFKPKLSWAPGKNAVAHDVYFNEENLSAVYNATRQNPMGVLVSQGQDPNFYIVDRQIGSMAHCYWRIDEIDNHGNIATGDLWSFHVHEYKGRFCFPEQTPVWIGDSLIPISTAVIGQGIGGIGSIEKVQVHDGIFTLYDIILDSGNYITVAENHYFMTEFGKWTSLLELKAGTRLKTNKSSIGIRSIKKQPIPYTGKVYNLEIKGSDQYMVGEDAVIVRDY
jgi:hypothetical protein